MRLFDGNKHAYILEQKIANYLELHPDAVRGDNSLGVILIGTDEESKKYVTLKQKLCEQLGLQFQLKEISSDLPDDEILALAKAVFTDPNIKSVLVQLPLSRPNLYEVLSLLPEEKDVDMMSPGRREKYFSGNFGFLPPVARALEYFLKTERIEMNKRKAIVVGKGFLVGSVVERYLQGLGAHVVSYDVDDNIAEQNLGADLIVLAADRANIIKGENILVGAHVVDFGSPGNLNMHSELGHLGILSPSPGGMGPLVVRFLVMNHLKI